MRFSRSFLVLTAVAFATAACGGEGAASSGPSAQASSPVPAASTTRPSPQSAKSTPAPQPGAKELARLNQQLIKAAWDNDLRRARDLIARGADVNAKDNTVQCVPHLHERGLPGAADTDPEARRRCGLQGLIQWNGPDPGRGSRPCRHRRSTGAGRHQDQPHQQPRLDRTARGDHPGRRITPLRRHRASAVAARADLQLPSQRDQIRPLDHATSKGHNEIAQALRAALDADKPSKQLANRRLLAAAERGDATAAAVDIRAGADLETRDERGRTPLLLAVTKDRLEVARLLVYLGADPDALDDQHDTPWLVTGVTGSVDMLEVLLPPGLI